MTTYKSKSLLMPHAAAHKHKTRWRHCYVNSINCDRNDCNSITVNPKCFMTSYPCLITNFLFVIWCLCV